MKESIINFDKLPASALVDVDTVAAIIGRSRGSIWRDVRNGRMPKPQKFGECCTRWKVGDIRDLLNYQWTSKQEIPSEETQVAKPKKTGTTPRKSGAIERDEALNLTKDDLLMEKCRVYTGPCIYFLFFGDEIVYIGKTTNFSRRLGQHSQDALKVFDSYAFVPMTDDLDKTERALIQKWKPRMNTQIWAPEFANIP